MNQPPEYCPYCGTAVEAADGVDGLEETPAETVETPIVYRCGACEDYVFYNPTPGGSAVVVDGDRVLLVEDFRATDTAGCKSVKQFATTGWRISSRSYSRQYDEWKLPSGRIELGDSHVDRFGTESLPWLLAEAKAAIERDS